MREENGRSPWHPATSSDRADEKAVSQCGRLALAALFHKFGETFNVLSVRSVRLAHNISDRRDLRIRSHFGIFPRSRWSRAVISEIAFVGSYIPLAGKKVRPRKFLDRCYPTKDLLYSYLWKHRHRQGAKASPPARSDVMLRGNSGCPRLLVENDSNIFLDF
mmetsp:Transcript_16281/g.36613  ORF Transcript_16281/g.36613 Transcript_16281/m.36613 type:complete len:162 (-) Transcript_16281:120-605(-)